MSIEWVWLLCCPVDDEQEGEDYSGWGLYLGGVWPKTGGMGNRVDVLFLLEGRYIK